MRTAISFCRPFNSGAFLSYSSCVIRLGYARVSTYGQTLDAQLEQLRADGCAKVYREKASGAQADRRELLRMLKDITPGDVVTVTRIDRLARSTFDLFATVKRIVDAGGQFRSLAEPWADTATSMMTPSLQTSDVWRSSGGSIPIEELNASNDD
jgi:Resolvase, N terminal domain